MPAVPTDLTAAEYRELRPRLASHALFQFLRRADATKPQELLAGAPALSEDRAKELHELAASLAAQWGLTEALHEAIERAKDGALDAWSRHNGGFDLGPNGEYRVFNGPGYEQWMELARRAELHAAALVVDPYLSGDERAEMRMPSLPAELIERRR